MRHYAVWCYILRRLFGILRSSFSRHITLSSAVRHYPLCVQPTHHAGVDCSVFFARRSVDTSRCHRLFGIIRYAFSRHSRLSGIFYASSIRFPAALGAQLIHKPQYLHGDDRGHGDEGDHAEAAGDEVVSGRCVGGALDE